VLKRRTKITPLDIFLALCFFAGALYVAYRVKVGLNYEWNWAALPQYLFRYDPESESWVPNLLMHGLFTTIRLSIWGMLLATVIGTAAGILLVSRSLFRRLLGRVYVEMIRNLPPLVLVFIFYFFIGDQIMGFLGIDALVKSLSENAGAILAFCFAPAPLLSPFLSALMALAFFEGAFIAEIVRAGIQSIEKGQWEASCALGLSRWQQMRHVILPQATRRMLPPLGGQFISTIKDSAIVSVISIQDLTFQGMEIISATYLTFEVWIAVALLYFLLAFCLSLCAARLEGYMERRES